MGNNFTPIDIERLKGEENHLNVILLAIVTLTMAVLAILLFILIQKKTQSFNQALPSLPTITVSPTEVPTPTIEEQPAFSPSPTLPLSPTLTATISPMLEATESAQ